MYKDVAFVFLYAGMVYLTGYCFCNMFVRRLFDKLNIFLKIGTSWVAGSYAVIFLYYLLGYANMLDFVTHQRVIVYAIVAVSSSSYFFLRNFKKSFRKVHLIILGLLVLFYVPFFEDSLFSYLIGWDSMAIWMLKAKMFLYEMGFWHNNYLLDIAAYSYSNKAYPVGIPLFISGYYRIIQNMNDQTAQFLLGLFYFNLVLVFLGALFHILHTFFSKVFILVLGLCFVLVPNIIIYAHNGYMEIPFSLSFLSANVFYFYFLESKQTAEKVQAAVMMLISGALCSLIKNEGIALLAMQILVIGIYFLREKIFSFKDSVKHINIKPFLGCVALGAFIIIPHILWKHALSSYNLPPHYYFINAGIHPDSIFRVKAIIFQMMDELTGISKYGLLTVPLFLLFIFEITTFLYKRKYTHILPALFVISQIVFYSFIFFIASVPIAWQVKNFDRLLLHIIPSFAIVILYMLPATMKIIKEEMPHLHKRISPASLLHHT